MYETLLVDRSEHVTTVSINRPRRKNAVTPQTWSELLDVLRTAPSTSRALVLTGAGGDFCAGADLSDDDGGAHPLAGMRLVEEVCLALHRLSLPTIARVDGVAVGAGMNLALACDFVVASDRARFSEIFPRRGLSIDAGGSWLLPRLVGLHRAKELALLGEIIGAEQARDYGLVHRVVPADELDRTVADLAERLASGPPIATGLTKRLLNSAFESDFESALENETLAQTINLSSVDAQEAIRAFQEKREPRFVGR